MVMPSKHGHGTCRWLRRYEADWAQTTLPHDREQHGNLIKVQKNMRDAAEATLVKGENSLCVIYKMDGIKRTPKFYCWLSEKWGHR